MGSHERINILIIARTLPHEESKDALHREMARADHMRRGATPASAETCLRMLPAAGRAARRVQGCAGAPEDERLRRETGLRMPLARQEGGQDVGSP